MKISVIIPCYNRATVVAETIRCLLRQTLCPDEIIAVDDGSTDNTAQVVEQIAEELAAGSILKIQNPKSKIQNLKLPHLRLIRQVNAGPGAARNAGLAVANGEYIWFMDSDDLASHNKLEIQVRALEQSGADIAICPWIKCRLEDGRAHPETHVLQQRGLPRDPARALVCEWSIMLQSALFRRSLLDKVGGFDPGYLVAEDQLYFLKCLLARARVVSTPECLVVYRTQGANKLTQSGSPSERRLVDWARFLLEARRLFLLDGQDPSRWFFFRLRLWVSWKELAGCDTPEAMEISGQIASVLGSPSTWAPHYVLAESCLQWFGGFRQRAFGDRSPLSMRASRPPRQSGQGESSDIA
ncbi:MAG: glycosyltransferase family 2 protein, partial [Terrimicrobiaceae bacterium]